MELVTEVSGFILTQARYSQTWGRLGITDENEFVRRAQEVASKVVRKHPKWGNQALLAEIRRRVIECLDNVERGE